VAAHSERPDSTLELVRQLDPIVRASLAGAEIEDAVNGLAQAVVTRSRIRGVPAPRSRRLKLAFVAAALAVVVGVGVGVATAAGVFSARTGIFPSSTEVPIGGPGEELNPAAPDFRSVALKLSSDIPYPSGYRSWRDLVITREIQTADGGLETTGALHGYFAGSAFCAWVQDWRHATSTGDSEEAQQAATTIAAAPGWSAVTAEDPHPDPSAANDPGAETGTLFGWMLPYRAAVLAGDGSRVDHLLATGYGDGKCRLANPHGRP
jgi:hypothetical protein